MSEPTPTASAPRFASARVTMTAATITALVAITASPALATQQRTFVASTGSDAAACTLGAPCRSFAAAIARTAPYGEVIVLDSAGYGPVTITKSVSLIAPQGIYAGVTVASGDGVTINAPGATVVLRGLAINGQGGTFGVRVHDAQRVRIESCVVSNMDQDGIHHEAAGAELVVLDTIVRDNGNFGINLIADASIVLDHVRSEHNDTSGLRVGAVAGNASAAVSDSVFAHNGGNGILVYSDSMSNGSTATAVQRSTLADNSGAGFWATGSGAATVAHSAILRNGTAGVDIVGNGPEFAVTVSDNGIVDNAVGIRADGTLAAVFATRNALATNATPFVFMQGNGAYFGSMHDNVGKYSQSGSISTASGN